MNARIVIVAYKPKAGMESKLKKLAIDHYPRLKAQQLVTDRTPILMEAQDGTIIEVFEWKSAEAIQQAHTNKAVGEMWMEFNEACEYVPIGQIPENSNLFAEYAPIH
jgi:hypothetical protein